MRLSHTKQAILALILANIIWGAASPIFKWSLLDIHVFSLAFLRYFIPTVAIGLFCFRELGIDKKDLKKFFLSAFFGITLNISLYFIAIQHTQSINQPIIASAAPVFTIIGAILFLNERPKRKVLLGNLIGLTGILVIVVMPFLEHSRDGSVFGNLLLVASTIVAVVNTIVSKELLAKYNPLTVTFWVFLIGSLTFLPLFIGESLRYGMLTGLTIQGEVGILYGSLFSSFFAWFLFYWGLKYILASETVVFSYIDPVTALLIAAPLLHEYPSPLFVVGCFLVFFGIYVAEGRLHWHPLHKLFQ